MSMDAMRPGVIWPGARSPSTAGRRTSGRSRAAGVAGMSGSVADILVGEPPARDCSTHSPEVEAICNEIGNLWPDEQRPGTSFVESYFVQRLRLHPWVSRVPINQFSRDAGLSSHRSPQDGYIQDRKSVV